MSKINADVDGIILTADSSATLSLATSDVVRATIDSSGNVGIGTASPGATLEVAGGASNGLTRIGQLQFKNSSGSYSAGTDGVFMFPFSDGILYSDNYDGGFAWRTGTGSTERMRIDSSGNVGIGVTPSQKLDVAGTSRYTFNVANAYTLQTSINAAGSAFADDYKNALSHIWQTSGTERMRIDSSGNVGIGGTAAAGVKLSVLGTYPTSSNASAAINAVGTIPSGSTSSFAAFAAFQFTNASFNITDFYQYSAGGASLGGGATVTNNYCFVAGSGNTFATNNYGFYSNIASAANRWNFYAAGTAANYFAGNVGINVSPSFKLQVSASTNVSLGISDGTGVAGAITLNAVNDAASANIPLDFRSSATYFSAGIGTTGSAANAYLDSGTSHQLLRSTSSLRYKRDVADYGRGLIELLGLRPVSFKGTSTSDGEKVFAGLIAEEVHDAGLTEFVAYDKEGRPDALHYGNMVALLVKAVQELTARVAELEAK